MNWIELRGSLEGLGWQPHRRMPEYIRESVENHLQHRVLPASNTQDDLLPLFSSNLSQDLIRDEDLRQEPDDRVDDQGISIEALSFHDYDLPEGQEVELGRSNWSTVKRSYLSSSHTLASAT